MRVEVQRETERARPRPLQLGVPTASEDEEGEEAGVHEELKGLLCEGELEDEVIVGGGLREGVNDHLHNEPHEEDQAEIAGEEGGERESGDETPSRRITEGEERGVVGRRASTRRRGDTGKEVRERG